MISTLNEFLYDHHEDIINYRPTSYSFYCSEKRLQELQNKLKKWLKVNLTPHITFGSSQALSDIFCTAKLNGINNIIYISPTFHLIEVLSKKNRIKVYDIFTTFNDEGEKDQIINTIQECKTYETMVYICNPNNPTNLTWTEKEMINICERNYKLVIIDEAYIEYTNLSSMIKHIETYQNLIVVRTFSKFFGLANTRIGYYFTNNKLFDKTPEEKIYDTSYHNLNSVELAIKCLDNYNHYLYQSIIMKTDKLKIEEYLHVNQIQFVDTPCNFILVHSTNALTFAKNCSVNYLLPNYYRLTIGKDVLQFIVREKNIGGVDCNFLLNYSSLYKKLMLERMYKCIENVFNVLSIPFWIECGSLLGCMRNSSIIPYDDDVDIGFEHKYREKLIKNMNLFTPFGFRIRFNRLKTYLQIERVERVERVGGVHCPDPIKPVHIDLFTFEKDENNIYRNTDKRFNTPDPEGKHCNFIYEEKDLFPLITSKFTIITPLSVKIPQHSHEIICKCLTPNYKNEKKFK